MIRFRDGVRVLANPEFGASQHIAHIVLTVLNMIHPIAVR